MIWNYSEKINMYLKRVIVIYHTRVQFYYLCICKMVTYLQKWFLTYRYEY